MADAADLDSLSTLEGNASVNGVKVGETLTGFVLKSLMATPS